MPDFRPRNNGMYNNRLCGLMGISDSWQAAKSGESAKVKSPMERWAGGEVAVTQQFWLLAAGKGFVETELGCLLMSHIDRHQFSGKINIRSLPPRSAVQVYHKILEVADSLRCCSQEANSASANARNCTSSMCQMVWLMKNYLP